MTDEADMTPGERQWFRLQERLAQAVRGQVGIVLTHAELVILRLGIEAFENEVRGFRQRPRPPLSPFTADDMPVVVT